MFWGPIRGSFAHFWDGWKGEVGGDGWLAVVVVLLGLNRVEIFGELAFFWHFATLEVALCRLGDGKAGVPGWWRLDQVKSARYCVLTCSPFYAV